MSEAVPTGRFEWERIVRRIQMSGSRKLVALILATYADPDGTRVRPGNDMLADVTGQSEKNVRRILAELRDLRLLRTVARGGGRGGKGKATEYQLTVPADLFDRVALLGVNERRESPDTQMSAQSRDSHVDNPVDEPESPDTQESGRTVAAVENDRTSDTVTEPNDRTFEANDRTSGCPTTTHIHHPQVTNRVIGPRGEYHPRARARRRPPPDTSKAHTHPLRNAS